MVNVEWAALSEWHIADIAGLAGKCVAHDGGLPMTASFLERRYTGAGTTALGAFDNGRLLACGAVRPSADTSVVTGLVDPAHRGRGLGSRLLDQLIDLAKPHLAETESLTPEAHDLFLTRGFLRIFAEDVYRRDLTPPVPQAPLSLRVEEWTEDNQGAFYDAYRAAFAGRPGFPDWSREQWIDWLVDDEFLPGCSLVAMTADGRPAGFVTCAEGFLIQVGAVPEWRRRGLGRALAAAALDRMRAHGCTEVFLDVNVDNPASAALFQGLGFAAVARRARYERGSALRVDG